MAGELKHKDIGPEQSRTEWEGLDTHEASGQTQGDILTFGGTYWQRLAKGVAGQFLKQSATLPEWGDLTLADLISSANILHIPTNAGWTSVMVNGSATEMLMGQTLTTSVNPNSSALLYAQARGFGVGGMAFPNRVNWDKKMYFIFLYARDNSDAQVAGRFQLKEVNTIGALAAKGIGLRSDNYALFGESYGTALGAVNLGVSLLGGRDKIIVIVHDPAVPQIEFWVEGALAGTQAVAANIPSGVAGATSYLVHSIANGAAGGVNAYGFMMHPKIWQARW